MASKRIFDLPVTKTEFVLSGIISGTEKNGFYTEKDAKNGSRFRAINFGVEFAPGQTEYVSLNGMPRQNVYFYDSKSKKTETVAWADRNKSHNGQLIGIKIGLEKDVESGKNINRNMTEYDACEYVRNHLKDDMSIYIRGTIDFSLYVGKDGNPKRSTKFVPTQISLLSKPIDFDADDFQPTADFRATIIYQGIDKEKDDKDKATGRFVIDALHVAYADIVPTTFVATDGSLATNIKKGLKPFNSIEIAGSISSFVPTETVEVEDSWGTEKTTFDRPTGRRISELVVKNAKPSTIDKETYAEDSIAAARKAIEENKKADKQFGEAPKKDADTWGTASTSASSNELPWSDDVSSNEDEVDW